MINKEEMIIKKYNKRLVCQGCGIDYRKDYTNMSTYKYCNSCAPNMHKNVISHSIEWTKRLKEEQEKEKERRAKWI